MNNDYYYCYDLPVPYKTIKIYPIKVIDQMMFNAVSQCLLLEKNIIPDAKIISMTDLEYIFHATKEDVERKPYLIWFDRLLSLCIPEDKSFENIEESMKRYGYDEKGKVYFIINEEKYNSSDYEKIKAIICEQNMVELPDLNMSKEVRDSLEEARNYKNRLSGTKPASMEEYLVSIAGITGWTFEYIQSMTIRKFIKTVRRLDNLIHYKIYLAASMSGIVTFKDTSFIKHWLVGLEEKEKYSDVILSLDEVKNKVSL